MVEKDKERSPTKRSPSPKRKGAHDENHTDESKRKERERHSDHSPSKRKESVSPEDGDEKQRKRKRRSMWDTPPDKTATATTGILPPPTGATATAAATPQLTALLTPEQMKALENMQKIAIQQQQLHQTLAVQQAALAASQARAIAVQSRIYVGSIHFDLTEADIMAAFGPFGPIKSINLSKDTATGKSKGFCFIEYTYPEAASAALQHMNGFMLAGRPIKVGRPVMQNGVPMIPTSAISPSPTPSGTATATTVPPTSTASPLLTPLPSAATTNTSSQLGNRVYVGSVHWDLTAEDIKSVFQAFGTIKSCALMPNPETGKHKGYGFVEFESSKAAEDAITHMNGIELGGRPIKVGRAVTTTPIPIVAPTMSADAFNPAFPVLTNIAQTINTSLAQRRAEDSLSQEENMTISGGQQRFLIMQKLARGEIKTASRVLILRNMVGPDEVDQELEGEVTSECSKYGIVERVVIYQERQSNKPGDVVVKIFVAFANSADAQIAFAKLNNRWFGGRVIKAELYDEDKFIKQDYGG
jgi:poly(U)-binding-splicing factor PUF60